MNTRLAASRPHEFLSEQSELFRPRSRQASDEVARGRLVSLERLPFAFPTKHGELHDWPWGIQAPFASPRFIDSTPNKINRTRVYFSDTEKAIYLLRVKFSQTKVLIHRNSKRALQIVIPANKRITSTTSDYP